MYAIHYISSKVYFHAVGCRNQKDERRKQKEEDKHSVGNLSSDGQGRKYGSREIAPRKSPLGGYLMDVSKSIIY